MHLSYLQTVVGSSSSSSVVVVGTTVEDIEISVRLITSFKSVPSVSQSGRKRPFVEAASEAEKGVVIIFRRRFLRLFSIRLYRSSESTGVVKDAVDVDEETEEEAL